jgi:hypothetical protein
MLALFRSEIVRMSNHLTMSRRHEPSDQAR